MAEKKATSRGKVTTPREAATEIDLTRLQGRLGGATNGNLRCTRGSFTGPLWMDQRPKDHGGKSGGKIACRVEEGQSGKAHTETQGDWQSRPRPSSRKRDIYQLKRC